jgi:Mg2+/Co2+ transporter CorB
MDPQFDLAAPIWLLCTLIVALLSISAFFSIAETALVSASWPRLYALAKKGNRRAEAVLRLRARQDQVLSGILLGNNLVNIVASALATGMLIELFGDAGVAYAAIVMTALVVIFGEVLPKTMALDRPVRILLVITPVLRLTTAFLSPLNRAIQATVRATMWLLGLRRSERGREAAEEELRGAIEMHTESGSADRPERAMLRSILDLAEVEVGAIMIHRRDVFSINADQRSTTILEQALTSAHTRIPLWRGQPDNIVGILHAKALLRALRTNAGSPDAINILEVASKPWFIPESTSLLDQLGAFRRRREHFALVVDEYGGLQGVVTLEDILEEIVGPIAERHEFQLPGVKAQPDGAFIVDGNVTIRDLNRDFAWNLPDEHAATIAGLVLHEARMIPEVGQVFTFNGFRFEVLRRKRNRIVGVRISPPARSAAESAEASMVRAPD